MIMQIANAMHKDADWVTAETPISDVAALMQRKDIGAVPVGRDDRLVGMITDRDIALRVVGEGRDPSKTVAADVMTPDIIYCHDHQSVEDAIHVMDQRKIRRLPVLNDKKRMVGMISLGDIAHSVSRDLTGELTHAVAEHHG